MAGKRGGARPGAGRKKTAVKHLSAIAAAEKQIGDRLPFLVDKLFYLANGGFERVEEKWEPNPRHGVNPAEPELTLVERKFSIAAPDRAALQYLTDRVMGRAKQTVEADHTSGGKPFDVVFYLPENGRNSAHGDDQAEAETEGDGDDDDGPAGRA